MKKQHRREKNNKKEAFLKTLYKTIERGQNVYESQR